VGFPGFPDPDLIDHLPMQFMPSSHPDVPASGALLTDHGIASTCPFPEHFPDVRAIDEKLAFATT
jgi:hypothetical protein